MVIPDLRTGLPPISTSTAGLEGDIQACGARGTGRFARLGCIARLSHGTSRVASELRCQAIHRAANTRLDSVLTRRNPAFSIPRTEARLSGAQVMMTRR